MTTNSKKEIEKFSSLAQEWWDPEGNFKPLHLFNPVRIEFIKKKLISHFKLDPNSKKPLQKLLEKRGAKVSPEVMFGVVVLIVYAPVFMTAINERKKIS